MTTPDAVQTWFTSAFELAHLPSAITEQMRRRHHRRADGSCAGPHGPVRVAWPCSSWQLAETADRIRAR